MLALAHGDWARCILGHFRPLLESVDSYWRLNMQQHFEQLLCAVTTRMAPVEFVELAARFRDGRQSDEGTLGAALLLDIQGSMFYEFGSAASRLLRNAEWTAQLLADLARNLLDFGQTNAFENDEDAAYLGGDAHGLIQRVDEKARVRGSSGIATLALGVFAERAASPEARAYFLLNVVGRFFDELDFDLPRAHCLAQRAVDLQLDASEFSVLLWRLREEEISTLEFDPDYMRGTPFEWSRALLKRWLAVSGFTSWLDKNPLYIGEKSAIKYIETSFATYFLIDDYADFETAAAVALVQDVGAISAQLALPMNDICALLRSFVAAEVLWRSHVSLNSSRYWEDGAPSFPEDALSHFYSVVFLGAWAAEADFARTRTVADCATLARELAKWPLAFRQAASHLLLTWMAPAFQADAGLAKLGDALVLGGRHLKKIEEEEEEEEAPIDLAATLGD